MSIAQKVKNVYIMIIFIVYELAEILFTCILFTILACKQNVREKKPYFLIYILQKYYLLEQSEQSSFSARIKNICEIVFSKQVIFVASNLR